MVNSDKVTQQLDVCTRGRDLEDIIFINANIASYLVLSAPLGSVANGLDGDNIPAIYLQQIGGVNHGRSIGSGSESNVSMKLTANV
jgi:hypothetical protein